MTYKESFLMDILKILIKEFEKGRKTFSSDDIYNLIPYGNGYNDYIIIPSIYRYSTLSLFSKTSYINDYWDYYHIFDIRKIKEEDYIYSIYNNIWKYLDMASKSKYIDRDFNLKYYVCGTIDVIETINIDDKIYNDIKDDNKIDVELYSIREACNSNRNNEFCTIIDNYIYATSSMNIVNKSCIFISKEFIYDELFNYIEILKFKFKFDNIFDNEVFYEFLKLLKINHEKFPQYGYN